MEKIRCSSCRKLLARAAITGELELKCPRCKKATLPRVLNSPLEHQEQQVMEANTWDTTRKAATGQDHVGHNRRTPASIH